MKPLKTIITSAALCLSALSFAQEAATTEKATYGGDNFSLEGALAMFKQSSSPEEFEKLINQEGNNVNNLDLDNDGETDYVIVQDIVKGDTHVLVLSTYTDNKERQDIATINIEKTGNERAILQIEGDENLYADNTILEPEETKTTISNGKGPDGAIAEAIPIVINVWLWPAVRYIYAPAYVVYVSPWHYRTHPVWYRPWRPVHYNTFYTHCAPYRTYYRPAPMRRMYAARTVYAPHRHSSAVVVNRSHRNNGIHNGNRGNAHYNNSRNYRTNGNTVRNNGSHRNAPATVNRGNRNGNNRVVTAGNLNNTTRVANNRNTTHGNRNATRANMPNTVRTAPQTEGRNGNRSAVTPGQRSGNRIETSGRESRPNRVSQPGNRRSSNRVAAGNNNPHGNNRHAGEGSRGRRN